MAGALHWTDAASVSDPGALVLAQLEQFEPRSHVFREAGLNGIIDLRSA
jgi:hypothetical protein